MSRQPSPRLDQLRALREAKFARAEQRQREEERAAAPRPAFTSAEPAAAPVKSEKQKVAKAAKKAKPSSDEKAARKAAAKPAKNATAKKVKKKAAK